MYDKVFEKTDSLIKPMNKWMTLNVELFDAFREKQSGLVREMMADSIEYAKGISQPALDVESIFEAQKAYWGGVKVKLTTNAHDNYDLLTDAQGKVGELLQSTIDTVKGAAIAATVVETPAKQSAKVAPVQATPVEPVPVKPAAKKAKAKKVDVSKAKVESTPEVKASA